ncbi:MAG: substrate-binding domain-containing protein [Bifidobacteriaceae bacterium]|nr:substrate-binding domain-containing protein [Bifidobacteriaceae bacterium]
MVGFLGAAVLLAPAVFGLGVMAALVVGIVVAKRPRAKRIWATLLSLAVLLAAWVAFGIGAMVSAQVAQQVGLMALVSGGSLVVALLAIWRPFAPKARYAAIGVVAVLVAAPAAAIAAQEIWRANLTVIGEADLQIDLARYEPFGADTLAASLDQPASLRLTGDLPRLDGATALYPVYASFARATYPEARYEAGGADAYLSGLGEPSAVACSTTAYAFDKLVQREADAVFLMGVSQEQFARAAELGLELKLTPIGREAFVFFVNQRNPVSDLSAQDIRRIYSGEITNWASVGGRAAGIEAYQRNANSGSQTAFLNIMGDTPAMTPPLEEETTFMSMTGVVSQALDYRNASGAIGFSFRYYLEQMILSDEIKMLSVDGFAPTPANIASGDYPFTVEFFAVTVASFDPARAGAGYADEAAAYYADEAAAYGWGADSAADEARAGQTERLIDWITSAQGQELVERVGYVRAAPR